MMSGSSRRAPRRADGERLGVHADFAMVHQAVFAFVHEFDRILHRDDVVAAVLVRVIHHGRQRGGFAGAGRAGDDHQPAVQHGELLEDGRQRGVELLKILEGQHLAGNLAEDRRDAVLLVEEIGAEPGDVGDLVAEIDVAGFLERA